MRWRDPKLWLGVAAVALVVVVVFNEQERTSPGPLTRVHAGEPELVARGACEECHGAGEGGMAQACSTCHAEIGVQLAGHLGFHGSRKNVDVANCALCHVEHHGDAVALVDARIFALAGVADVQAFEHDFVDFRLLGKHVGLACDKCHKSAQAPALAKGQKRFLGAKQECASCHEDVHKGAFDKGCDACHGQERPFTELGAFVHTDELPLAGAHANLTCVKCHEKGSPRSIEALGGAGPKAPARRCQDCHESPHSAGFVDNVAATLGVAAKQSCVECHSTMVATFKAVDTRMRPELHAASGFALGVPHDKVSCEKCHAPSTEAGAYARMYTGRRADACAACHVDVHRGQFASAGQPAPACIECHAREHFKPALFDVAMHERTAFPLTGAHIQTACNDCHVKRGEEPQPFRGVALACEACHVDVHGAAFTAALARAGARVAEARGTCGVCHGTARFDETQFGAREHGEFTSFALREAHADAKCETCHVPRTKPDRDGRTFGLVAERFPGPADTCSTCHRDVHRGAFDKPGLPAQASGAQGCARCHGERRFKDLVAPFDHDAWTPFPLDGAHTKTECAKCHGAPSDPRAAGRTLGFASETFAGPANDCATCHADVHAGEFDKPGMPRLVAGEQTCARCHTSASFATLERERFDHVVWTGFALDGEHSHTACEACHVPTPQRDAKGRRFGRAAGTLCADCHADPHANQFASTGAGDCARCHASPQSWARLAFDHNRDSRYALDKQHARLECSACHKPWPLADGREVVRYKPLGVECRDCHGFTKQGTLAPRAVDGGGLR